MIKKKKTMDQLACAESCFTCSGPGNSDCISCSNSSDTPFLKNGFCLPASEAGSSDSSFFSIGDLNSPATWIPLGIYGVLLTITGLIYFFSFRKYPKADNVPILTTGFAVLDFITGWLFVYSTYTPDTM